MLIPMIKKISMELKIEFSGYFSGDSNMNLNATKCTFGHSDITSRKQQKRKNDLVCIIEIILYL